MNKYKFLLLIIVVSLACLLFSCKETTDEPEAPTIETPEEKDPNIIKVIYWNLQCGMWCDQGNNYDNFVAWVQEQDPDICVWNEAETTFDTGIFDWSTFATEKYLPEHWPEVAARYGHSYVKVNGASKAIVVTSKFPFEREKDLYLNRPKFELRSGSTIYKFNLNGNMVHFVTLHLWPQQYDPYVAVADREKSRAAKGGDLHRTKEIVTLCDTTICKRPDGANENWIMLGDFNARSPQDNDVYKYDANATALRPISYVLNSTPYQDAVKVKHPYEFITSTFDYNHRIDYIFTTPPLSKRLVRADILKDHYTNIKPLDDLYPGQFPPRSPSDHYPVMILLDMNNK